MKLSSVIALLTITTLLSAQGIEFEHTSWKEAMSKAKEEGKAMFVDSYATWCGPCKRMSKQVFTQSEVGDFYNENFINIKLDMEKEDGVSFGHKYPVSAYPTLFFLAGDGKVIHKEKGGKDKQKLIDMGELVLRKYDTSGQYTEAYEKGDRNYNLVYNYVKALNKAGKPSLKISNEYIRSKPDITEDERLLFLLEAAVESDSKLFAEVISNCESIKKLVDQETFVNKITRATDATVKKAVEYEVPSLLDEAIDAYQNTVGNEKLPIIKMKRFYYRNTGGKSEFLDLSKKQFKEVKNDEVELGKLLVELKSFEKNEDYYDLLEDAHKAFVKLNSNDKSIMNYCNLLMSREKKDEAVKVVEKKLEDLKKNEEKSLFLERYVEHLKTL